MEEENTRHSKNINESLNSSQLDKEFDIKLSQNLEDVFYDIDNKDSNNFTSYNQESNNFNNASFVESIKQDYFKNEESIQDINNINSEDLYLNENLKTNLNNNNNANNANINNNELNSSKLKIKEEEIKAETTDKGENKNNTSFNAYDSSKYDIVVREKETKKDM